MTIVDGAFIASEHLLVVGLVLLGVILAAIVAVASAGFYYDWPGK